MDGRYKRLKTWEIVFYVVVVPFLCFLNVTFGLTVSCMNLGRDVEIFGFIFIGVSVAIVEVEVTSWLEIGCRYECEKGECLK